MIKDIVENNNKITIENIHNAKIDNIISKFKDANGNFDMTNFEKYLKQNDINVIKEGYSLNFLGKRASELLSAMESTTVFVPDVEHNNKEENKNSENIYISADNLEALRHLKNSYHNKIKCIYIDPPYNTGNDGFCYNDKFSYDKETLSEKLGINIDEAERILSMESAKSNSHSAWLSFMYARLLLAQDLLTNDGIIFISIDEHEMANLKLLCDEIFGEENQLAGLPTIMNLKGNNDEYAFAGTHEYTLVYAKNKEKSLVNQFVLDEEEIDDWEEDEIGYYKKGANLKATGINAPREKRPNLYFPIYINKINKSFSLERESLADIELLPITDGVEMSWRWSKLKFINQKDDVIININGSDISIYKKQRPTLGDLPSAKPKTLFYKPEYSSGNGTQQMKDLFNNKKLFNNPKPIDLISDFIQIGCNENDIILDFFGGSSTSAVATIYNNIKYNKKINFIIVQYPENLDENLDKSNIGNKDIIINQIELCNQCNYPHTLDYIGIERIKRSSVKYKLSFNKKDIDYGFKRYTLVDKSETLDKLESFDPNMAIISQDSILSEFSLESRLITFLCDDGFGLNAKYDEIDLNGYKAYLINGFLYLLDKGFDSSQNALLIEKVDKSEIKLKKIVIFGYAFDTRSLQQLKDNAEKMGIDDDKDIIIKY